MTTSTVGDLEIAQAFARAYREIDEEAMRRILVPAARIRVLLPKGYSEHSGADAVIALLREFAQMWRNEESYDVAVELYSENRMRTGRMAFVSQRCRLRSVADGAAATMVVKHLIAIVDGRIALVDELCSGVMPEAR